MTELKSDKQSCIFIITTPRFNKLGLFRLGKYDNPEDKNLLKIDIDEKNIDLQLDDQFIVHANPCFSSLLDLKYKALCGILRHFSPVEEELNIQSFESFSITNSEKWFVFDYQELKTMLYKICSYEGPMANFTKFIIKLFSDLQKKHEDNIFNMTQEEPEPNGS